jgi:hypothetical protein
VPLVDRLAEDVEVEIHDVALVWRQRLRRLVIASMGEVQRSA